MKANGSYEGDTLSVRKYNLAEEEERRKSPSPSPSQSPTLKRLWWRGVELGMHESETERARGTKEEQKWAEPNYMDWASILS